MKKLIYILLFLPFLLEGQAMKGSALTDDFDVLKLFVQSDFSVIMFIETPCGIPDTMVLQDGLKRAFLGACDNGTFPSDFGCADLDLCDLSLFNVNSKVDTTGLYDFVRNEIMITNIFDIDTSGLKELIADCISTPPSGWDCEELDNCNMTFLDPNSKVDSTGLKAFVEECFGEYTFVDTIVGVPTLNHIYYGNQPNGVAVGSPQNKQMWDIEVQRQFPVTTFDGASPMNGSYVFWDPNNDIALAQGNPTFFQFVGTCRFYFGVDESNLQAVTAVNPGNNPEVSQNNCMCDITWNTNLQAFEAHVSNNIPVFSNPLVRINGHFVYDR